MTVLLKNVFNEAVKINFIKSPVHVQQGHSFSDEISGGINKCEIFGII